MLALIAVVSHGTPLYEIALKAALAYGVLWFALGPCGAQQRLTTTLGLGAAPKPEESASDR
jgi:hypothetical protein